MEDEPIILEYDNAKNKRNIAKRDLPFDLAALVLADPNAVCEEDMRKDYGEPRYITYGMVAGMKLRLCWTPRGEKTRVITLYQVHDKEWSKHYEK